MKKHKKDKQHKPLEQDYLSSLSNIELPEDYSINEGFLIKYGLPVSLVTAGLLETAGQGFLHVDEAGKYRTE